MKKIHSALFIGILALSVIGCNNSNAKDNKNNNSKNSVNMKFEKVALPYATDALEPVISKQTV